MSWRNRFARIRRTPWPRRARASRRKPAWNADPRRSAPFKKGVGLEMALRGRDSAAAQENRGRARLPPAEFTEHKLEPALAEARAGAAHVFFVDAAHVAMGRCG
jgi:hypothetical protein